MPNLENYLGFHNEHIRVYKHRNLTVTADKRIDKTDAIVEWIGDIGRAKAKFSEAIITGILKFSRFGSDKIQKLTKNQLEILKEIEEDMKRFLNS